jgi:hypothetical protein
MQRAFLSRPAARPTRLGNFNPASTTGSSTRRLQYAQASGVPCDARQGVQRQFMGGFGIQPEQEGAGEGVGEQRH